MSFDVGGIMDRVPKPLPVLDLPSYSETCCTPLVAAPLTADQAEDLAGRLKAIADPTRLRLLSMLLASEGMVACTCDLTGPVGLTQPTVTHHLKKLAAAGLVIGERRGTWTFYRVVPDALAGLASVISPA